MPEPVKGRGNSPERCDSCGSEGFRLTLSPDGEAQVCDGCLAALTAPTIVRSVVLRDPGLPTARLHLMSDGTLRWEDGV